MITIQLPNGRNISIEGTDDPKVAAATARTIFAREHPEEYTTWEQSRPLPGFFQGIVGGARQGLGGQLSGLGAQLGERGLPGEQTLRSAGEAVSGQADPGVRQFTGISDFGRELMARPGSAIPSAVGQAIGALAGSAALPLAAVGGAALAGASAPVVGAAGLTAAIAGGALGSTNELEQLLIKEGVDPERARSLGANPGALIGAVEGGLGGYALSRLLGRQIRGAAAEELVKVAQRSASRQAMREAGTSGALETGSEALGGAARQAIAAAETGNANIAQRLDDVALDALMGAIGGGGAGAIAGSRAPGQAMERLGGMQMGPNPPAPGTAPPPAEPPAPTFIGPQAPPLPEAPAPVTTFEEAAQLAEADPIFQLPPGVRDPEVLVAHVNTQLQQRYADETEAARQGHLDTWLGRDRLFSEEVTGPNGKPTTVVRGRDRQAKALLPSLYQADKEGRLSLQEGFQPEDVANLATESLNETPTAADIRLVRNELKALQKAGVLRARDGAYFVAPTAPPAIKETTTSQDQAQSVLSLPNALNTLPPKDFDKLAEKTIASLPQPLAEQATKLVDNIVTARELQQEEQTVSRDNPENTARLLEINAKLRDLGTERAQIADVFQGIVESTARVNTITQVTPTTDVGRTDKTFPGDMTPDNAVQILRNAKNLQERAQAAQDEKLLSLFDWMLEGEKGNLSTDRWKSLFKNKVDIDIDTATAENAVRVAREAGITNGMNTIVAPIAAPTQLTPKPAPAPKAAKPSAPAAPEAAPAAAPKMTEAERKAAIAKILTEDEAPAPKPKKKLPMNKQMAENKATTERKVVPAKTPVEDEMLTAEEAQELAMDEVLLDMQLRPGKLGLEYRAAAKRLEAAEAAVLADAERIIRLYERGGTPSRADKVISKRLDAELVAAREAEKALSQQMMKEGPGSELQERMAGTFTPEQNAKSLEAPAPKPTKKAKAKPKLAAVPTASGTRSAEEVAAAQAAFTQVVGQNGRLTFEERLDVDNLAADVQQAAQESGISGDISGYAQGDLAVLSLATSDMPLDQVAIHEGQHIAEFMGLYKPNEIAILNANADKIRSVIKARLPYVSDVNALPLEEVRAYGVNARVAQKADFGPLINHIFDKFGQFTQRLGNLVRGRGFQSWQDVYDRFLGGEMGKRPAVTPDGAAILFAAPAPSTPNNKYLDAQIGFFRAGFSSLSNIAKDRTAIRPAAGVMDQTRMRRQESEGDLLSRLESAATLSPADRTTITRAWEASSKAGKLSPQAAQLAPNLRKVFDELVSSGQQAFNYVQESMVIDKFMPNEGMPAAQRAKLEAMWARHSEKHLWDIPKAELQAASPDGWREMQVIEQKRNKFYMPMLANGTHFIAAYKKDTKGNRVGPPVKMAIYTPPNLIQRARGFANTTETARQNVVNALKAQGLDPTKHYIMENGVQLTQNEEAYGIRQQGDFISNYLKDLHQLPAFQTPGAAREKLAQINRKLDKDMADRLFRQNEDILVAVTPENQADYVLDMVPTYLLGVSNIQARRYTQEAWTRSIKNLNPKDVKYLNELRDYATSPNVAFSNLRTLTFFSLMGGAFDSALLNAAQILQTTAPMLSRDGGSTVSARYLTPAYGQVLAKANAIYKSGKSFDTAMQEVGRNAAEKAAIAKAVRFEVFSPLNTTESRGQATAAAMGKVFKNGRQAADNINKVARLLATPQQVFEQANRASTFIAAYRLAVDNPDVIKRSNKYDNRQITTPYDYAVAKVNDTHYITTKEDRALFQRFTPAAEVVTQFMSYTVKTMELYVRHANMVLQGIKGQDLDLAKAGALGVIRMARNLILLAGVWALPGADFLKEAIEKLTAFFWGSTQNFDADLNRALGGGQLGAFVTRGAAHSLGGLAISNRMKVDPLPFNDLAAMNATFLLGPSGSFIDNGVRSAQFFNQGDWVNGLASFPLMPRFMGNVIRGADFATSGEIRTPKGENIISAQQTEKMDRPQLATAGLMALGFQTSEVANLRDAYSRNREVAKQTQSATINMNTELAGYLTASMEALRKGDSDESQRQINRLRERAAHFQKRNQEFLAEGRPDLVLNINFSTIQQRAQLDYFGRTSPEALRQMGNARQRLRMQEEYDLRVNPR